MTEAQIREEIDALRRQCETLAGDRDQSMQATRLIKLGQIRRLQVRLGEADPEPPPPAAPAPPPARRPGPQIAPEREQALHEALRAGKGIREIERTLGFARNTIAAHRTLLGIPAPGRGRPEAPEPSPAPVEPTPAPPSERKPPSWSLEAVEERRRARVAAVEHPAPAPAPPTPEAPPPTPALAIPDPVELEPAAAAAAEPESKPDAVPAGAEEAEPPPLDEPEPAPSWSLPSPQRGRRKVSTTIYMEPHQDAALRSMSRRTGVPVAEYVRRGIENALADPDLPPVVAQPPPLAAPCPVPTAAPRPTAPAPYGSPLVARVVELERCLEWVAGRMEGWIPTLLGTERAPGKEVLARIALVLEDSDV